MKDQPPQEELSQNTGSTEPTDMHPLFSFEESDLVDITDASITDLGRDHWWQHRSIGFWIGRAVMSIAGIGIVGGIGFGVYAYQFTTTNIITDDSQVGFFGQVQRIVNEDVEPLQGEEEDRINILLLGQGGLNHPGGGLTDTVMIASIRPSDSSVALLSLPRDMVIPYGEGAAIQYRKLNYMMELGGIEFARELMLDITGLEMHYYALVDFEGFRNVIDTLGGVEVDVQNAFTDYQYPDYNFGYQTIAFEEGINSMDGETALQFARSRHGNNGEGSDFARAERQQLILSAVRDKALSASTFLNPARITGLLQDIGDNAETDMEVWEILRFADLARSIDTGAIESVVVDNGPGGILYSEISSQTGAYVLIPTAGLGNYSELQSLALGVFEQGGVMLASEDAAAELGEEAIIGVQNGTTVEGLAARTADTMLALGLSVDGVSNAASNEVSETIIYDLSDGSKPETRALLEERFSARIVSSTLPVEGDSSVRLGTDVNPLIVDLDTLSDGIDFLIILGADYQQTRITGSVSTSRAPRATTGV